jgi:hypothetical protein
MSEYRLRLSGAHQWVNCPGSPNLCATIGPQPSTPEADEGTQIHKVGEMCLQAGFDPEDLVGRTLEAKGTRFEVTPEMAEVAGVYVDHVRKQFMPNDGTCVVRTEHQVSLASVDPEIGGTLDATVYDSKTYTQHIDDLKAGAGIAVEIDGNLQIMGYALGAFLASDKPIERVEIHVVQPRCEHPDGPIRSKVIEPMDLLSFGIQLREAAERTRQPDAPLVAGPWCQTCDARGMCPRLYEDGPQAAEQFELEDAILAAQGATLPPSEVGKRLDAVDKLRLWLAGITRFAWFEAQRGHVPEGYKLVTVKGKRTWQDGELAMRQAARQFKISEDKLFTRRPISPRKLENLVGEKEAAEFIKAHIGKKRRSVSLVRESDPRPAVRPSVMDDLQDILCEDENGSEE